MIKSTIGGTFDPFGSKSQSITSNSLTHFCSCRRINVFDWTFDIPSQTQTNRSTRKRECQVWVDSPKCQSNICWPRKRPTLRLGIWRLASGALTGHGLLFAPINTSYSKREREKDYLELLFAFVAVKCIYSKQQFIKHDQSSTPWRGFDSLSGTVWQLVNLDSEEMKERSNGRRSNSPNSSPEFVNEPLINHQGTLYFDNFGWNSWSWFENWVWAYIPLFPPISMSLWDQITIHDQ